MRNLPLNLKLEKNRLSSDHSWIVLLEIHLDDSTTIRLTNDNQSHTFQGNIYEALLPFEVTIADSGSQGEIPAVTLRVGDAAQILTPYVKQYNGGVGSEVKLILVDAEQLTEDYSELELTYEVTNTQLANGWIEFTLGAPNPLRKRFPPNVYLAEYCSWQFKSAECKYSGSASTCNRTLDDCRKLGNVRNFGGFPGLARGGIKLA